MTTTDQIITRWLAITLHGDRRANYTSDHNVFALGDQLFSYGTHFELARAIRVHGKVSHWLLNGDRYSNTTARHQAETRAALTRTGLPMVIIPHTALVQAGIQLDSIRIADVTADRWLRDTIVEREFPARAVWGYEIEPVPGTNCYLHPDGSIDPRPPWQLGWKERKGLEWVPAVPKCTGRKSLLTQANSSNSWELFDNGGQLAYRRETRRHLLGESLITARVFGRQARVRFLSGFDANETRPSYFFCELPRTSRAHTVAEAYADLKPATVRQAEQLGRDVKRQGDIYAVPLPSLTKAALTKQGAIHARQDHILNTNHVATETATLPDGTLLARGTLRHAPAWRRPDHKRVSLGTVWHVILKNTVPVTA